MKRFYLRSIPVLLFSLLSLLFFCSCEPNSEIKRFYNNMERANNAEIVISMENVSVGQLRLSMKIEDNKMHQSAFMGEEEKYREIVGYKIYTYTKENGVWKKDNGKPFDEEFTIDSQKYKKLFDENNYEYNKKDRVYVIKEDADVDFFGLDVETFNLTIEDDSCIFEGEANLQGIVVLTTIEIKNVGSTKVTLPEV